MLRCHYQVTGSNERCRCTFCAASNRSVWILVTEIREAKAAQRARPVQKAQETGEINFGWVSHCIAEAASANNDLVILREFDMESDYLETDQPGHYFGHIQRGRSWLGSRHSIGAAAGRSKQDPIGRDRRWLLLFWEPQQQLTRWQQANSSLLSPLSTIMGSGLPLPTIPTAGMRTWKNLNRR